MGDLLPYSSAPSLPCGVFVFSSAPMSLFVVGRAWPLCPKTMHSTCFNNSAGETGKPASLLSQLTNQLVWQTSYKSVIQLDQQAVELITSASLFAFMTSLILMPVLHSIPEQGDSRAFLHNSHCNSEVQSASVHNKLQLKRKIIVLFF